MAEQIEVQIVLEDGSIQKGFAKIQSDADKAAKGIGESFSKETTSLGKLVAGSAIGNIIAQTIISGFTSAFRGISGLISQSINEAAQSESNINRLNNALATTGQFSQSASASLVEFAGALQSTTTFSDDAILSTQSLLIQIGRLGVDEVPRATQATLDLAAALRIDLDSAARLVGKAAEGNAEAFKRYGVEIQKGATDAQTFANVLTALEQRFGGSAQREVNTFAGANAQLGNTFSDLLEEIGKLITQSPTVIAVIKTISSGIVEFTKSISAAFSGRDLFGTFIDGLFSVSNAILQFVFRPLELLVNLGQFVFESLRTGVQVGIVAFSNLGLGVAKVLNLVGILGDQSLASFQSFADSSLAVLEQFSANVQTSAQTIGQATITDSLSNQLVAFKDTISITRAELQALDQESQFRSENAAQNTANTFLTVGSAFSQFANGFNAEVVKLRDTATQGFQQVGAQALRGIGQGVGSAFAAFGKALASGENGLEAFAKAFLATIGQVAIQLGTEFILRGIAYSLDPFLAGFGPPLIGAGAALAAFGGVLSAVGGGGGGGGGGGASAAGITTPEQQLETFDPVEQKPQTQVAINVQGNILDRRETGLEIAKIIQESFDNNDAILVRG